MLEKNVLKVTELGFDSCWIGYFDHQYFNEFSIENDLQIPALVIIGKGEDQPSLTDRLMSTFVKAKHRNDWKQLFYNEKLQVLSSEDVTNYVVPLEMLRLAPSAGNLQPWRVIYDRTQKVFHFYKVTRSERYEAAGLHDIDMGIAIAHFDLAAKNKDLKGEWMKATPIKNVNWTYILSWKII